MSFFKRLIGRESPEEKAIREAEEAKEKADKLAKEMAKKEKEAAEKAEKAAKKEREEKEKADKEYMKKFGKPPPSPLPGANAISAPGLSHEQQLKAEAMAHAAQQQQQAAQHAASEVNPLASLASSSAPASAVPGAANFVPPAGTVVSADPTAMPIAPPVCDDCGALLSIVHCDDCAAAQANRPAGSAPTEPMNFCRDCDAAFHRGKRAQHNRRFIPTPSAVPAPVEPAATGPVMTSLPVDPTVPVPPPATSSSVPAPSPAPAPAVVQQQPAAPVTPAQPQLSAATTLVPPPVSAAIPPSPVAPTPAAVEPVSQIQQQPLPPQPQLQPVQSLPPPTVPVAIPSVVPAPLPQQPAVAAPFQPQVPELQHQVPQQAPAQLQPLVQSAPLPAPVPVPAPAPVPVQKLVEQPMQLEPISPPPQQQLQPLPQPPQPLQPQPPSQAVIPETIHMPTSLTTPVPAPVVQQQFQPMPPQPVPQQQEQVLAPLDAPRQPARPLIPSLALQQPEVVEAAHQEMKQNSAREHTPRQLDAYHRRTTPRTPRDDISPRQPSVSQQTNPQQQQQLQQQQLLVDSSSPAPSNPAMSPPPHVGLTGGNDLKELHPEEVAELRLMFDQYDLDRNEHLALDEVSKFLAELEFTYSEQYIQFLIDHVFGMHIHQRTNVGTNAQRSVKGMLTFDEFLEFMKVFYWLHDHVVAEIERQFMHAFHKQVDDECIAILCRLVRFNEYQELDFNEMNLRLVEAVNDEAAREEELKRNPEASPRTQLSASASSNPLAQQHLAQQAREDELRVQEMNRAQSQRSKEMEDLRAKQMKEEDEKRKLMQQREQFRAQAIQQQQAAQLQQQQQQQQPQQFPGQPPQFNPQLSAVQEYPDPDEDRRTRGVSVQPNDDDPFAAHDSSSNLAAPMQSPVQLRMDMASRLAASLDQSDEEYMKNSWYLLLKHFDKSKRGGISVNDMGQAFRAMGLDPSPQQLTEFFVQADLDRSGIVDYNEFKQYYSAQFNAYLRKGLELGQLRKLFKTFDEDSNGTVSQSEFAHAVKRMCHSELSDQDIQRLCRLADRNNDGDIDFKEFLDLIRLSTADSPASPPPALVAQQGESADVVRHEQMMAYRAARALTRKIIRAHMPSPMEHILAYSHMPSTFRPSMLARYQSREEFFPSSILNPVLHCSGLHYEQFQMDPRSKMLRPTPLYSSHGTADPNFVAYHIELEYASGIPLPDVSHRADIVARRVRVCILDGSSPLSNLYIAKAEWDASEEDRWKFQLKFEENDWNSFVFKTTAKECTVLFELTCLVKKQGGGGGSALERKENKEGGFQQAQESNFVEMSCGFTTLDLDLAQPLQKETRLVRGIMGGNMEQREMIKDSEVLARRSGWKAMAQLFSGPVKSQLSLKISPVRSKDERQVSYFRYVPCNLILTWSSVEVVKLFLEILASFILLPQFQPLQIGKSCQLSIQLFLKYIVDTPDLLQVLAEVWSETRKSIKKVALREHDNGAICHAGPAADVDTSSAFLMDRYRECIMKLYPIVSMASNVLPPLVVGVTDLKRLSLLRVLVHADDTLRVLTNDGMMKTGAVGAGGSSGITRAPMSLARANSVQNLRAEAASAVATPTPQVGKRTIGGYSDSTSGSTSNDLLREMPGGDPYAGTVEFRNIFAPFHTNEISFDPNAHSEDHHVERRAQIEFDVQIANVASPQPE